MDNHSDFAHSSQLPVFYIEKNPGKENTVFFIHGNSGSSRTWEFQFNSNLFNDYRLIAFDLPGTGHSTLKDPTSWDFSPIATGKILAESVNILSNGNPYVVIGFSYGTNVAAEMFNHALTPAGIVLVASCVVGSGYTLDKVFAAGDSIFFHDELPNEEVRNFFESALMTPTKERIDENTEDFFLAKPPFRSALIQSVGEGKVSDEIVLIKELDIPVQLFFGLEDKILQINYLDNAPFKIWRDTIYKLPGAGHYVQSDQPAAFDRLLAEYLGERFTIGHV